MLGPVTIESLDHEGQGVAHLDGKVMFIQGALLGETVTFTTHRSKASFAVGAVERILQPSSQRVTPRCPHYGICGGCAMQHLDPRAQVAAKQRVLEDNLARIGRVHPEVMLPAVHGAPWGYRYRARLSVRNVVKKGGVLVGFHERGSSYVAEMGECHVLPPRISALVKPLRAMIGNLTVRAQLPQVELAIGEHVDVLVLRILAPLTPDDEATIRAFADQHGVCIYLQPKGAESLFRFHPVDAPALTYTLPEFDLRFPYSPIEFTQVNHQVNRVLVHRAMTLLDPQPGERIADFFCGLGNFSLAIARRGAEVLGLEGSEGLVQRARENAAFNGLSASTAFEADNLFTVTPETLARRGRFDKWLVDPPRDGAMELVKSLTEPMPRRIVYVSCSPSTLARDAGVLVNVHGYRLEAAGVINMFPHTAHVESIALFER
ncbi:MAG: 23S rRNA (uracil(1939)-C(5))-methyltransferase RlmD [Burkholderiales bacterium]|nr:23S rRNA (uracil(1939)-C(5))-methyltransferase RlmD [Burkholderiales bacterium]